VEVARASFLERGYPATTIRAVAEAPGVSQETVCKSFRGKAGLLKAVYDVTLAGDDEEQTIAERPPSLAVTPTPAAAAAAYVEHARTLNGRAWPLLRTVLSARGTSAEIEEFARVTDAERLVGAGMSVAGWDGHGWLRPGLTAEWARDIVWMMNSPAVLQLAGERGWTEEQYYDWLTQSLLNQVLRDKPHRG
jgi:AcrR family transcriptional regulator